MRPGAQLSRYIIDALSSQLIINLSKCELFHSCDKEFRLSYRNSGLKFIEVNFSVIKKKLFLRNVYEELAHFSKKMENVILSK